MPPHHHVTVSPNQSVICLAPCHQTSQSFDLPSTTASPHHCITVPPHHCITVSLHHHITVLVSHLPCPLPPNQSVICLAPCHQTSQSFDLPSTTASPHHRITVSQHHHVNQSFTLPPATKLVSHLPCPLPQNPGSHLTRPLPLHHHITVSPHHRITMSPC